MRREGLTHNLAEPNSIKTWWLTGIVEYRRASPTSRHRIPFGAAVGRVRCCRSCRTGGFSPDRFAL